MGAGDGCGFPPEGGAAIYQERCASCHEKPEGRVAALTAIRAMTGEAMYAALTNGAMKTQAAGLSTMQLLQLIGFIGPTGSGGGQQQQGQLGLEKTCQDDGVAFDQTAGPAWAGWSPSAANTRYQDAKAAGLTAAGVAKLKLKWAFHLGGVTVTRAQPVIAGGRVFTTSGTGAVYSLDAGTGCTY